MYQVVWYQLNFQLQHYALEIFVLRTKFKVEP